MTFTDSFRFSHQGSGLVDLGAGGPVALEGHRCVRVADLEERKVSETMAASNYSGVNALPK